jgi:hypothetical protein
MPYDLAIAGGRMLLGSIDLVGLSKPIFTAFNPIFGPLKVRN